MQVRFRIHDKETYPDGAIVDIPDGVLSEQHSKLLAESLVDGADGVPVAGKTLRTQTFDVGAANVWLDEPTLGAVTKEMERVEGEVRAQEAIQYARKVNREHRRGQRGVRK